MSSLALLVVACVGTEPASVSSPPPPSSSEAPVTSASTSTSAIGPSITTTYEEPGCTNALPLLPGESETVVFMICGDYSPLPYPVPRPLTVGVEPLVSALGSLVSGSTEEEQALGLGVGFDQIERAVADRIEVVAQLDVAGILELDFLLDGGRWSPGTLAGTSAQLFSFVDPLYATAFQFPEVTSIDLSTLCWGELDCTEELARTDWEGMVTANSGRSVGFGCGLLGAWFDPGCGANVPPCGDDLTFAVAVEGATGSAVYHINVMAPSVCFVELEGTVTVLRADGTVAPVVGSPIVFHHRGLVDPVGYSFFGHSQLVWVMGNWCESGGTLQIDVNGHQLEAPAGGRCDTPGSAATIGSPYPRIP